VAIVVGYDRANYGVERVVYGAVHPDLRFVRVPHAPVGRLLLSDSFWRHVSIVAAGGGVDLVHVYNDVVLSSRPWIASFEDTYPVGRPGTRSRAKAIDAASARRCRGLLAISAHARRRLARDPEAAPALLEKTRVCLPCVPSEDDLYLRHREWLALHPASAGPVRCLFAGNLFFLKGGEFVLDALEPLVGRDPGVELTVISSLEADSFVSRVDDERRRIVAQRLESSSWIHWERGLSPRQVRERMATSHLLLFPSLNETFGFVLAEAMATGLEAVTVATRAIPEILPPEALQEAVTVRTNEGEEWFGTRLWRTEGPAAWMREWRTAGDAIVSAIRARVGAVAEDLGRLERMAPRLRARHDALFAPERLGERLVEVYRGAFARTAATA